MNLNYKIYLYIKLGIYYILEFISFYSKIKVTLKSIIFIDNIFLYTFLYIIIYFLFLQYFYNFQNYYLTSFVHLLFFIKFIRIFLH